MDRDAVEEDANVYSCCAPLRLPAGSTIETTAPSRPTSQGRHVHVKRNRIHHALTLKLHPNAVRDSPRENHVELHLARSHRR